MKKDLENKAEYLKYLKVSQELIRPCYCKDKVYHQYCKSADVVRNNSIYCKDCDMAYDIFVKKEKFCNEKLMSLIFSYSIFTLGILIVSAIVLVLDAYLKTLAAHKDLEKATKNHEFLLHERKIHTWSFNYVPDYREPFSLRYSVRWTDMIHLVAI